MSYATSQVLQDLWARAHQTQHPTIAYSRWQELASLIGIARGAATDPETISDLRMLEEVAWLHLVMRAQTNRQHTIIPRPQ